MSCSLPSPIQEVDLEDKCRPSSYLYVQGKTIQFVFKLLCEEK